MNSKSRVLQTHPLLLNKRMEPVGEIAIHKEFLSLIVEREQEWVK